MWEDLTTLQKALEKGLDRMFDSISKVTDKEIIFVSDELGMGIVPANAMSPGIQGSCRVWRMGLSPSVLTRYICPWQGLPLN